MQDVLLRKAVKIIKVRIFYSELTLQVAQSSQRGVDMKDIMIVCLY